jgi:hypothetical protein
MKRKKSGLLYSLVEGVCRVVRHVLGDDHRHDQPVDGQDTRHDDGNDGLHDELRPHDGHGGDTRAGFGRAIGSAQGWNTQNKIPTMLIYNELYSSKSVEKGHDADMIHYILNFIHNIITKTFSTEAGKCSG